jgi:hypothetical protein
MLSVVRSRGAGEIVCGVAIVRIRLILSFSTSGEMAARRATMPPIE